MVNPENLALTPVTIWGSIIAIGGILIGVIKYMEANRVKSDLSKDTLFKERINELKEIHNQERFECKEQIQDLQKRLISLESEVRENNAKFNEVSTKVIQENTKILQEVANYIKNSNKQKS